MKYFVAFILTLFLQPVFTQVGIKENNPKQALDVNGKVKIGNDGATPSQGTVRFNGDFEGFTADGWTSFTQQRGSLPTNPIPITSWTPSIPPGAGANVIFYDWAGNNYSTVPSDKRFIVTGIYPTATSSSVVNNYYSMYFLAYQGNTSISYSRIRINSYDNETRYINGDQAPLIVLNAGQYLRAFSYGNSEISMSVSIRGFMVDDLFYQN